MSVLTNTLPAWRRRNCTVCPLHATRVSFLPPNNSLKPLTGCFATDPAGWGIGWGAWPASVRENRRGIARFRRAASRREHGTW